MLAMDRGLTALDRHREVCTATGVVPTIEEQIVLLAGDLKVVFEQYREHDDVEWSEFLKEML